MATQSNLSDMQYIEERVTPQIELFMKKGKTADILSNVFQILVTALAAAIPFFGCIALAFGSVRIPFTIIMGALGAAIVTIEAVSHIMHCRESRTLYTQAAEQMKHEIFLYRTGAEPYEADDTSFSQLVYRVENIILSVTRA